MKTSTLLQRACPLALTLFLLAPGPSPASAGVSGSPFNLPAAQENKPSVREFPTGKGGTFVVNETHPVGASLSDLVVTLKEIKGPEIALKDANPLASVLVGDLDGNGFNEIYLHTVAAGSGSYGNIIGVATPDGKSLVQITMPEVSEKEMAKGGLFEGYQGHDRFAILDGALIRTFPVKGTPSGTRSVSYRLVVGKTGFSLVIKP